MKIRLDTMLAARRLARLSGLAFTALALAISVTGSVGASWYLGRTLVPKGDGPLASFTSPALCLALLAAAVEALRFTVALQAEQIWRNSRFQSLSVAAPLWLACTVFCTLVPLLLVVALPSFQAGVRPLVLAALAWTLVQVAAGLLPALTWPRISPEAPVRTTASKGAPTKPPPARAATASEFLDVLTRFAELPAGSRLSEKGRVDGEREIVITQADLASLVGRSPQTVRRWLQDLERKQRIVKSTKGKEMCIRLPPAYTNGAQHPASNGDARPQLAALSG